MFKLKTLSCISSIIATTIIGCDDGVNKKNESMSYAEHRVSFVVLKADCFTNLDTNYFKVHENSSAFLYELQDALRKNINPGDAQFFKWQKKYDTAFDYMSYANAQLKGVEKRIDTLSMKNKLTEDDIEFLQFAHLHLNCAAFFNDSWYVSPEIKFSENFYRHFFKSKEKKLFEHYLYDSDTVNEFRLPVAGKYPGKYDYIPAPHIIDKTFAKELLVLLKVKNDHIDVFLSEEANFFEEILAGVVNDKYVLTIKVYM